MLVARKILAYLLSLALLIVLLVGVLSFNVNLHFDKSDNLKHWLSQSQFYDHFVSNVTSQSQISLGGSGITDTLSLNNATIQQVANNAFPPQLLQGSVNQFLDANYAWLQGRTTKPQFAIDLNQAKQNFANQVGQYVQARLASLPVCSLAQLESLQTTDPLTIPCRPPNISAATEGSQITQQLASSGDFLPNPVLTADNLQSGTTRPYYQKISFMPKLYRWSSLAPLILAIIAIVLSVTLLFILPRRQGLRKIAGVLLLAGLLLIATKFSSDYVFNKLQAKLFNNSSVGPLQNSLTDVAHQAETALAAVDLYFGIGLIVAAVLILILVWIRHRDQTQPIAVTAADTPTDSPQAQPPATAIALTKKASAKRPAKLIQ